MSKTYLVKFVTNETLKFAADGYDGDSLFRFYKMIVDGRESKKVSVINIPLFNVLYFEELKDGNDG
jgi:hypothetical protein